MAWPPSKPGRHSVRETLRNEHGKLAGWGVKVQLPDIRAWYLLVNPKDGVTLCTSLTQAREWMAHYEKLGCRAKLVETVGPRRRVPLPKNDLEDEAALAGQETLF